MKVLLINGSPNEQGCTHTALGEVASALNAHGINTQMLWIGKGQISGCSACQTCKKTGECVITRDLVNMAAKTLCECQGLVVGAPVYYAGPAGQICAFLDRMFYSSASKFAYKPYAAVCSARRAGTTATLERLNKYAMIANMPLVPSQYWNMVHGNTSEEVLQDKEGLQIMRTLGKNMAWLLSCIQSGPAPLVSDEPRARTNFVR